MHLTIAATQKERFCYEVYYEQVSFISNSGMRKEKIFLMQKSLLARNWKEKTV
jgi:hypothetical protein